MLWAQPKKKFQGLASVNEHFILFLFCFVLFFGHTLGMWKFLAQGSNPSHSSDIAQSLTTRPPGNSSNLGFEDCVSWATAGDGTNRRSWGLQGLSAIPE